MNSTDPDRPVDDRPQRVGLGTIAREWTRIGCIGFGGPPTHILLLRRLCVTERKWLSATEFEDGIAATNLLPGPASTQLAIFCAWRLRGVSGAVVGALCFIVPGLVLILGLATLFLSGTPPRWVTGAAAGAGAAVAAVAAHAAIGLIPASRARADRPGQRLRWTAYLVFGGAATIVLGPWLVLVLIGCGAIEVWVRTRLRSDRAPQLPALLTFAPVSLTGMGALAWVAVKVGALSYGGGFVIIPLMQADAVNHYHWMTNAQFLNAVALGQITPGPVVQTVAVVGYAAGGIAGGLLAAVLAFTPSFLFVVVGAPHFQRLRSSATVQAFFDGAGPAVIGAIGGSTVLLAAALTHMWQFGVLTLAAGWLLGLRRGVVSTLLGAGILGMGAALANLPIG
ncbi:chromate efflux transporter [Nocardia colli]|uniref:Chromate efflux transporter n=1 Tax=Nocardia colli TaxID=2545717 RepID=A0A5N0ECW9_9NOCA|nr:chromate efflux transporter [Nocardia colli]KAA8886054.1 chromate efflux transporter [Nocardia colli]